MSHYICVDPGPTPGVVVLVRDASRDKWFPRPLLRADQWSGDLSLIRREVEYLDGRFMFGGLICEDWSAGPKAIGTESVDTIKMIGALGEMIGPKKFICHPKATTARLLREAGLELDTRRDDTAIRWAIGRYYGLPGKGKQWKAGHAPFDDIARHGHALQALGVGLSWLLSQEGYRWSP
jgi:hypothetical protein